MGRKQTKGPAKVGLADSLNDEPTDPRSTVSRADLKANQSARAAQQKTAASEAIKKPLAHESVKSASKQAAAAIAAGQQEAVSDLDEAAARTAAAGAKLGRSSAQKADGAEAVRKPATGDLIASGGTLASKQKTGAAKASLQDTDSLLDEEAAESRYVNPGAADASEASITEKARLGGISTFEKLPISEDEEEEEDDGGLIADGSASSKQQTAATTRDRSGPISKQQAAQPKTSLPGKSPARDDDDRLAERSASRKRQSGVDPASLGLQQLSSGADDASSRPGPTKTSVGLGQSQAGISLSDATTGSLQQRQTPAAPVSLTQRQGSSPLLPSSVQTQIQDASSSSVQSKQGHDAPSLAKPQGQKPKAVVDLPLSDIQEEEPAVASSSFPEDQQLDLLPSASLPGKRPGDGDDAAVDEAGPQDALEERPAEAAHKASLVQPGQPGNQALADALSAAQQNEQVAQQGSQAAGSGVVEDPAGSEASRPPPVTGRILPKSASLSFNLAGYASWIFSCVLN